MHQEHNSKNKNKFTLTVVNHDDTIKPAYEPKRCFTFSILLCVVFTFRCEYLIVDHYIYAPDKTSTYPKRVNRQKKLPKKKYKKIKVNKKRTNLEE